MIIFLAGDLFGRIKYFYNKVLSIENQLGIKVDWVLQTGNFGIYPDPARADLHMRNKGALDFSELYYQKQEVPRKTLFISGSHEDHQWMNLMRSRGALELLPNLHWLLNGYSTAIGNNENTLRVAGMGKVFSNKSYHLDKRTTKKVHSHYLQREIEQACSGGSCQLLLQHQAGHGERIGSFVSNSEGLSKICFATRPELVIHGSYNVSKDYINKSNVNCVSLAFGEIKVLKYENKQFTKLGTF